MTPLGQRMRPRGRAARTAGENERKKAGVGERWTTGARPTRRRLRSVAWIVAPLALFVLGLAFIGGSSSSRTGRRSPDTDWTLPGPWTSSAGRRIPRGVLLPLLHGNTFDIERYGIGVARSTSPTGPFVKSSANPILRSDETFDGPGRQDVVQDRSGEWRILYHARLCPRSTDGTRPTICPPTPRGQAVPDDGRRRVDARPLAQGARRDAEPDAKLRLAPSQALPSSSTCPPTTTTRPTQPGPAPSHAGRSLRRRPKAYPQQSTDRRRSLPGAP
jgi:hypothetical protein